MGAAPLTVSADPFAEPVPLIPTAVPDDVPVPLTAYAPVAVFVPLTLTREAQFGIA
jgi:hypothetical protein